MGNTLKTTLLLILLTVLFIWIGQLIGGTQGATIAFGMALAMNFFSYWFSDKIVLAMYRAKPLDRAQMPHVWALLESLSAQNNIPLPKLFLIENEAPNAFATGRSPKHASVAVTSGILNLLTPTELKGVLAHELSHVKNRDTLTMTITASIAGAIMWLADMARWNMLLGGQARDREDERGGGSAQLIIMLVIIVLAPIAAMLIQLAISRSREYEADHTGAKLAGNPEGLAGALLKLENSARQGVTLNASPATAHLFIMNPLHGKNWTALFSTHPPIEERVKRLREMK